MEVSLGDCGKITIRYRNIRGRKISLDNADTSRKR